MVRIGATLACGAGVGMALGVSGRRPVAGAVSRVEGAMSAGAVAKWAVSVATCGGEGATWAGGFESATRPDLAQRPRSRIVHRRSRPRRGKARSHHVK